MAADTVRTLCARGAEGHDLSLSETEQLLRLRPDEAEPLSAAAHEQRRRPFGDAVFLYGFV